MTEIEQPPAAPALPPVITGDATSVVQIVLAQLVESEKRLTAVIDKNAQSAVRRWDAHDGEHAALNQAIAKLRTEFDTHLQAEREEDLVFDARIAPMRRLGYIIGKEWRTIAIAILFAIDLVQRNV